MHERKYLQITHLIRILSELYKERLPLKNKTRNNPVLRWARDLSRHFSSEDKEITNKYKKMLNIMSLKKYKIIVK